MTLINFAWNILWDGPEKMWKYVLHFLLNTTIIDAFLIVKESTNLPKRKYRQLDFRIALAQLLIGTLRTPKSTAGIRQQASSSTTHKFHKLTDKRSYCKNCSKSVPKKRKDTSYGCGLCDCVTCTCAGSSALLYITTQTNCIKRVCLYKCFPALMKYYRYFRITYMFVFVTIQFILFIKLN